MEKTCEAKTDPAQERIYEIHRTHEQVLKFAQLMSGKLRTHERRHVKPNWRDPEWGTDKIKMEIQRCLLDGDFVSVANYAMFANYHQPRIDDEKPKALTPQRT